VVLPKNLQILPASAEWSSSRSRLRHSTVGPGCVGAGHPSLLGTVRDQVSEETPAMVRFFACEETQPPAIAPMTGGSLPDADLLRKRRVGDSSECLLAGEELTIGRRFFET